VEITNKRYDFNLTFYIFLLSTNAKVSKMSVKQLGRDVGSAMDS